MTRMQNIVTPVHSAGGDGGDDLIGKIEVTAAIQTLWML
jgi:hypothetical protein